MARRLRWVVGLAAILLVLARLDRVLEPAVDTPDWRLLVPTATAGGVVVTWAAARLSPGRRMVIHVAAVTLLLFRITAPNTLIWGVLPGADTVPLLLEQLGYTLDLIRFGAPPILAVAGIAAALSAGMWAIGAAWARSVTSGPGWLGIVPSLAFYLYLSVVDRAPSSLPWNVAFVAVGGLALVATANPVPPGAGHLRHRDRPMPRWNIGPGGSLAAVAGVVAIVGASTLAVFVPPGGAIHWRTPGGEGSSTGSGFSASRFVDLRQSLISLSDEPVFLAAVDQTPPEGPASYWRMITLDRFTGEEWVVGDDRFVDVTPGAVDLVASESVEVTQTIQIESLIDDRLPSLFAPQDLYSNDPIIRSNADLGGDGNLRINALTRQGLSYQVTSMVPRLDVGELASLDGELTPIFAEAVAEGELSVDPAPSEEPPRPVSIDRYLVLPPNVHPTIGEVAREVTEEATSPFEQALLLEHFLQGFQYSTDVSTGHSALDLAAWLTEPDSDNYRTGYCEQFAAAMALMGRLLGLPTRVVIGFTPGETVETEDGPVQVVRQQNAHAWVEVWFDGEGWVGFDPTPRSDGATTPLTAALGLGGDTLERSPGLAMTPGFDLSREEMAGGFENVPLAPASGGSTGGTATRILRWGWLALVVMALVAAIPALKALRRRRRYQLARDGDVEAAWAEITDRLTDLGDAPATHQTPVEFASTTSAELISLARDYSAAVYGGQQVPDATGHLRAAERWIDESYDSRRKRRAMFSTRSLFR